MEAVAIVIPIVVSILIAAGGWIFTYFNAKRSAERSARLDRVNRQLRLLYGPLYARLLAGRAAWSAFEQSSWPAHGEDRYFAKGHRLSETERETWRIWMREVFHPQNERLESIIVEHMDLIDGPDMPPAFVQTLAHISAYHAVLARWEVGDYSEYTSIIDFPSRELLDVVRPTYERLMEERGELLALTRGS